eukprot:TRINITY_DN581_c0_g1_i1.p1 TRINITY_DN581_c0_g1~~TRINITY_DN581_c0_g1_i1.p1  ORF type:complete len:345 (+),score=84.69 TRINITY_DN581_c0_g1_i1:36-1037(+)
MFALLFAASAAAGPVPQEARRQIRDSYDYSCTGRCNFPVTTTPEPGFLLMGGGADVNTAFVWWLEKANGGDVVVLRASGDGAYNPYLFALGDVNSVSTIVFNNEAAAEDPFVLDVIAGAEAIFMAGGDQWLYMSYWRNSTVQALMDYHLNVKKAPIGGTSAGLAVLGEYVYTAETGSVISEEALDNPYHRYVDITDDSLVNIPVFTTLITDSHFRERDRMGRLSAFIARIMKDYGETGVRAVAVSEATAVCVEGDGRSFVAGRNEAYFVRSTVPPAVCEPGEPLTILDLTVYKCTDNGSSFNFNTWTGTGGTSYGLSAVSGVLISTQNGNQIY